MAINGTLRMNKMEMIAASVLTPVARKYFAVIEPV